MDFLLTRAHDLAVLGIRLTDFTVDGNNAVAAAGGARITVIVTPQHVDEQTVSGPPGEDAAVQSVLSGTSRMTFGVAPGTQVALTGTGILAACQDLLLDGSGATSIELPTRLAFEPTGSRASVAASAVTSAEGVTGLWLTRFAAAGATPVTLRPLDRTLAGAADVAFPTPLSADRRLSIVDHSATAPATISRLELTALGGSLTASGEWDGLSWSHRATLGRDQFVRTDERVLLYPFGFPAVLTTVTERDPDMNGVQPGEPAALYQRTTLRITETVLASLDGTALRRTFPFGRVEVTTSVFGGLAASVPDYTKVRASPDVSALQAQLDSLVADRDAQRGVWGPYVDGQDRTYDDLLRRGDGTAVAYQNADADFEPWASNLAQIEENDAAAQPYFDAIQRDQDQIDALQGQAQGPDGPDPDVQAQLNELVQDQAGNRQEAQQYFVDPGFRQQTNASYNAKKPVVDSWWARVQEVCASQPRDICDAINLGDSAPDVSNAAVQYQNDDDAIGPLQDEINQATAFDPDTVVTAWPMTAAGNRLRFPIRMSRGDSIVDVSMPMIIVYDKRLPALPQWNLPEYDSLSDPELPGTLDLAWAGPADAAPPTFTPATFDAAGAPPSVVDVGSTLFDVVGAAAPKPSDTQLIRTLNVVAARADQLFAPSLGRLASDGAKRWGLAVDLPALQQLAGPAVAGVDTSAVVGFAEDYAQHGENAAALFETVAGLDVDFTKAADRSGGLAALQLLPDGISREHGPAQLASLLAHPDPAALIGEAAGLLGFKLRDLIAALPNLTPPTIVSDLVDGKTPVVRLEWQHVPLQNLLAFKTNGKPASDPMRTELNLQVVSQVDGTVTDCSINDFALQFPFDDRSALIRLSFARLAFHQQTTYGVDVTPGIGLGAIPSATVTASGQVSTGTPKVDVDGFGLAFLGPLQLLETLQSAVDLVGKQPGIQPSPRGVTASYNLPVPDVACGAFALSNVTFHSRVDVPFDGAPISVDVGFASRDKPFALSVLAFSGGGYIDVSIDADGPRIDASLQFGASLAVDFVVAKGEVHALGGVQYVQQGDDVTITGFLRIGGSLEILSLVSVSVELRIALTYADKQLIGRATLVLEIDLTLWSDTVEIDSGPWVLAGGGTPQTDSFNAQAPSLLQNEADALAAVDAPVTDEELAAWQAYRAGMTGRAVVGTE